MKKKFTEDVLQNFEPERIPEKMIFIGNVEKGLLELDQGKTVPHDQSQRNNQTMVKTPGC